MTMILLKHYDKKTLERMIYEHQMIGYTAIGYMSYKKDKIVKLSKTVNGDIIPDISQFMQVMGKKQ